MRKISLPSKFKGLFKPSRYKVFYGGRGSGKSWAFAIALVLIASMSKKLILCAREIQKSLDDSVYRLICDVIELLNLSSIFEIKKAEIVCVKTGSRFIFMGLYRNQNKIKSVEGVDICWIEEADSVSQESWDYLIPTIRKPNSEIWIGFNPNTEDDPVYKNFVLNKRDGALVQLVNYVDNPFFPDTLREEMEWDKRHDPDKYAWIWEGNCRTQSEAQIFHNRYKIDSFDTPEDAEFLHGADWGFSQDPTTIVRCFVSDNVLYIDRESYGVGVTLDDTPKLFDAVVPDKKWLVTADSARPETIRFMNDRGYNVHRAKKGKGSVIDGIERLKSFDMIVIHPRCKHTIDEFRMYSYKVNKQTGDIMPVPEDKNNHIIDALRYATEKINRRKAYNTGAIDAAFTRF